MSGRWAESGLGSEQGAWRRWAASPSPGLKCTGLPAPGRVSGWMHSGAQDSALPSSAGSKPGPCPPAATSRSAGPGAAPVAAPAGSPGPWRTWRRRLRAPAWAACERGTVGGTRRDAAGTMPFLPEAGAAGRAVALALVLLLPAVPTGAGALLRLQPGM